jgi:predicted alpha/beta superfamily hydrolase
LAEWHDYLEDLDPAEHPVSGTLRVWRAAYSPQLGNERDIVVYLPPSHGTSDRRYPVIYMHDGQNLFDPAASFTDEWGADETMERLAAEYGIEAILVGIPNNDRRIDEYSPFHSPRMGGGLGERYVQFIAETVKPVIDADFCTLPDRAHTGILGSSLGGLISTYAFFQRADVFGLMGALSPAYWFAGKAIVPYLKMQPYVPGKIYLDVGTHEMGAKRNSAYFRQNAYEIAKLLREKGYRDTVDLLYVEEYRAGHNERAWARRLPGALRWLLKES